MPVNALQQVEEAVNLLRRQTARSWMLYLLGAVPLLLCLVTFARDMRTGFGADQCLAESLLCALVFFWASFWKARFAGTLLAAVGKRGDNVARNRNWDCVLVQSVLQAFKLCLLPFAVISVVPLPWLSALFRSINTEANRPDATVANTLRRAAAQASSDSKKNWGAMLICNVAGLIVFANVFAILLLLPELWKIFTGVETDWTRNGRNLVNGNTCAVALALTWLLVDPLLQAYSAIRSFYFEARLDGRDLLLQLQRAGAAMVIVVLLMTAAPLISAAPKRAENAAITAADVDRGIQQVAAGHEYDWVRQGKPVPADDWFGARVLRAINGGIRRVTTAISDFLDRLFRPNAKPSSEKEPVRPKAPKVQWLMYGLGALLAFAIVFSALRTRRSKRSVAIPNIGSAPIADLGADDVLASERPDEQWLAMAREYATAGELRLAIRAMYLSNLSYLGAQQLIGIAKSKSNSIYESELRARCRNEHIPPAFARANRSYEKVWYGRHDVTTELRESVEHDVLAVRNRA